MALPYRIFETDSFLKEFRKHVAPSEHARVLKKLRERVYPQLKEEPHYGAHIKKLHDYAPDAWRYRIGDLRLFYSLDEETKVIILTAIRARKDAYR